MRNLGIGGRILAIAFLALLAFSAGSAALIYFFDGGGFGEKQRLLLPQQISALVQVTEQGDAESTRLALQLVNDGSFEASVFAAGESPPVIEGAVRLPLMEAAISAALPRDRARSITVYTEARDSRSGIGRLMARMRSQAMPAIVVVGLHNGGTLVVRVEDRIGWRILGAPGGLWIGLLGSIIGVLSLLAAWREAKPIDALAKTILSFSETAAPVAVPASGSPNVRRLIETFNSMQSRIAELLLARTLMLGAVSHDLRTYVTRIRLRAEFMPDQAQREKTISELEEMTLLIDSALAQARGVAGERQLCDVMRLVAGEVERAIESGKPVTFDGTAGSFPFLADAIGLQRVFANLIDNAVRYGKTARVSTLRKRDGLDVIFDDEGPGIPESQRQAIFEPFYRAEASRNRLTGGAGLGLAIVRDILRAHGVSISAETAPSGGARFRVRFPAG